MGEYKPVPYELTPRINVTVENDEEWRQAVLDLIAERDGYRDALREVAAASITDERPSRAEIVIGARDALRATDATTRAHQDEVSP